MKRSAAHPKKPFFSDRQSIAAKKVGARRKSQTEFDFQKNLSPEGHERRAQVTKKEWQNGPFSAWIREGRVKSVLDAGAGQPAQFSNVIECFHFSDRTTLSGKNCDFLFIVLIIFNCCTLLLPSSGRQQRCMQLEQRSALRGHHRETGAVPF